ncbi:MAG TPA: immunoglobulin domain-containing protein [Verrucomicrobiae bacterium]|jgi:hypothetical protein|nr:immunoglobulin domain-containing protein [Verrucomicrobiae bacterium]
MRTCLNVVRKIQSLFIVTFLCASLAARGQTPPTITGLTSNQTQPAGTNVTINVGVTGTPPLYFQWLFDSNSLPNATGKLREIFEVFWWFGADFAAFRRVAPHDGNASFALDPQGARGKTGRGSRGESSGPSQS